MVVVIPDGRTTPHIETRRTAAREQLEKVMETLMELETTLLQFHDNSHFHTQEFKLAAEHTGSAWRAANYAATSIRSAR